MKHSYFSRRLLSVFMAFALGLSVLLAKDFVVVIDAGHGGGAGHADSAGNHGGQGKRGREQL